MPLRPLLLLMLLVGCGVPGRVRAPAPGSRLTGTWEGVIRPVRGQFPVGETWEFRDDGTYFRMRGLSFDTAAPGSAPVDAHSSTIDECSWSAGRTTADWMKSARVFMAPPKSSGRFQIVGDNVDVDREPSVHITFKGATLLMEDTVDHSSYELERVDWYRLPGPNELEECRRAVEARRAP
jgi:hypothetical protein